MVMVSKGPNELNEGDELSEFDCTARNPDKTLVTRKTCIVDVSHFLISIARIVYCKKQLKWEGQTPKRLKK